MEKTNKIITSIEVLQSSIAKPRISSSRGDYTKALLANAHSKSKMIAITDVEGSGKTTSVAEYYFNNENVTYVKVGQTFSNKTVFHEIITYFSDERPGAYLNLYSSMRMLQTLLLTERDKKKLIIIDDAGKLSLVGLGLFHELRDYTSANTGIVFIALPVFHRNLLRWRATRQGIGEFYRRIQSWHDDDIPTLTKAEKISFCHLHEITEQEVINQFVDDCTTFSELEKCIDKFKELDELTRNIRQTKHSLKRKVKSKFEILD